MSTSVTAVNKHDDDRRRFKPSPRTLVEMEVGSAKTKEFTAAEAAAEAELAAERKAEADAAFLAAAKERADADAHIASIRARATPAPAKK